MMEGESSMTATETSRLIDWLMEHGHSAEEATECIKYIADYKARPKTSK